MPQPIVTVDAFTDRPFAGNPAAVCLLDAPADPGWMQAVARELNLSETAFLVREGGDRYHLRWFTPTVEVDLCGHATLASAHMLREAGHWSGAGDLAFRTRSGTLRASWADGWIVLDFPANPVGPAVDPGPVAAALGVPVAFAASSRFDLLAEVESEAVVRAVAPDLARVMAWPNRGLIVTARSAGPGADFVSRFFAPNCGVPEDPVTGSAHTTLGPYWADRLGRVELVGHQVSARGGEVRVRVAGDRVHLAGRAVTVLRGELGPGPVADPTAAP